MSNRRQPWIVLSGLILVLGWGLAWSQAPSQYDEGPLGLALALRKLPVTGSFLHTAAHPDDEDNGLLVMLSRGRGLRTGLLTLTRGDGGQNEIGPELFQAIGMIRTGELLSMHEWTGAEQFFTRAFEFGYSFSVEETFEKWGREDILADTVRLIRRFRPNVIGSLSRSGRGGGQHHQTSALITEEAFRAAADPNRFPEQLAEGLHPWQALKLYERGGGRRGRRGGSTPPPAPGVVRMQTGTFDPLFNRTYAEIGSEARSMHKCQGMGQLAALPGPRASQWRLVDSAVDGAESHEDLLDGVETGLQALVLYAGPEKDRVPFLPSEVDRLASIIAKIQEDFVLTEPAEIVKPLAQGLALVRQLRSKVEASNLTESSKYQIGFLLEKKEEDFTKALELASQFRLEVVVDDGQVVPGQPFQVSVTATNASAQPLQLGSVRLMTPAGWKVQPVTELPKLLTPYQVVSWTYQAEVGPEPRLTGPFWHRNDLSVDRFDIEGDADVNAPWSPPSVVFEAELELDGVVVPVGRPAEYRYPGPWVGGEQRHELMVVPAIAVSVSPEITILPLNRESEGAEVRVTALYNGLDAGPARVSLQAPSGWRIEPAFQNLAFEREGQSITRRFRIYPVSGLAQGTYSVTASVEMGGQTFRQGYQVIDYDHIERRHLYHPARTQVNAIDVKVADGLKVGYVMGVGDDVPPALRQLGLKISFLSEEDLAFGDLSEYDTIITGVRAYLNRVDLKANNARLLDWVAAGGTLIAQYNKFEFNRGGRENSPYAPYPLLVGRGRVTDENAPVEVLLPDHPVFQTPNRIGPTDWTQWVQERGLYFIGEKSSEYVDLVSTTDPFEYNSGEKLGSLIEARHGKGRWIYVGLGLWRQLPAGVPGAFRLMANLVSLGGLEDNR